MRQFFNYILVCLVLGLEGAYGQGISFQPLDEPVTKVPMRTCVTPDGKLIAVSAENQIGFQTARLFVRQWNGQFWIDYPSMLASPFQVGDDNKLSVCSHAGKIYVAGSFKGLPDTSLVGIMSWNGSKWEKTAGGISSNFAIHKDISIADMTSYKDKLFVCGRFNLAGGLPVHNFVFLNNNQWTPVETGSGVVNDMQILNDTLYCAGKFSQVEGVLSTNIAAYAGSKWISMPSPSQEEILGLGIYQKSLFVFTHSAAYIKTGNQDR
jgi:hypothetical protein